MERAIVITPPEMRRRISWPGPLGWAGLALGPLFVFALFLLAVGADPVETYRTMLLSSLGDWYGLSEVWLRATPFVLTGLATALPAQARLVNVGAEGQMAMGALATAALGALLGDKLPMPLALAALLAAGALGGLVWAGVAGFLRTYLRLNETISTLLLNYVATLVVAYFVHGLLKDPDSFNWPFSPPLADSARLLTVGGTRLHWGVLLAPTAAFLVWYLLTRTFWGLRWRAVGGNPQAARRAGLDVARIQLVIFLLAGALAGMAGMIEVAGVEGRLRPTTAMGYGYVGFLAAWMAGHHPLWLLGSSLLLAVIAVSGDALQITAGLPSSSVNVLMALVLVGVLARGTLFRRSSQAVTPKGGEGHD